MIILLKADRLCNWVLAANDREDLMWYVDCAFGVRSDYQSHTGGGLTMEKGFAISFSKGHKFEREEFEGR